MCGIVGIWGRMHVRQDLYDALTLLQHRGQDSAGIATLDEGSFKLRKGLGLVRDIFHASDIEYLSGNMGIGHCRYPTAGGGGVELAQPLYVGSPYGIALAHNGNLTNKDELKRELYQLNLRHINTDSDSEVLLNVFADELKSLRKLKPEAGDIFQAVQGVHKRCIGGYAIVAIIAGYGMVGFRDPFGIRPIVFGERITPDGKEYIFASESAAVSAAGFTLIRDLKPGEAIYIDQNGSFESRQCADQSQLSPCIFEHVYLARPDSIMDGISIYKSRLRMGKYLAKKILRENPNHDIDTVIPVPDTSRISAQSLAVELGVKFREGLVKNSYVGRTFMMPEQKLRQKSVKRKLNTIDLEFRNRNVLIVDDSIVRGTTSKAIIQMARNAGAKKVYFASMAPPVRYPNVYGIDIPSVEELIAHSRTEQEVCDELGVDWLIYQDLDDLIAASSEGNPSIEKFDCSVFNGDYVTGYTLSNKERLQGSLR